MSGGYEKAIRDKRCVGRDLLRPVPRGPPRATGGRPSPPRRVERPRALAHPERQLDQGHPAGRCSRRPNARPSGSWPRCTRSAGLTNASGRALLLKEELRLLYQLDDPRLRAGAPRQLARMGIAVTAGPVRQARAHDPPPPPRHPRRHPPRALQRAPRGPQQPHPADQPPQLRLPLRRSPDRPRLPLLHRDPHRPPAMNHTPKTTGAPNNDQKEVAELVAA